MFINQSKLFASPSAVNAWKWALRGSTRRFKMNALRDHYNKSAENDLICLKNSTVNDIIRAPPKINIRSKNNSSLSGDV